MSEKLFGPMELRDLGEFGWWEWRPSRCTCGAERQGPPHPKGELALYCWHCCGWDGNYSGPVEGPSE